MRISTRIWIALLGAVAISLTIHSQEEVPIPEGTSVFEPELREITVGPEEGTDVYYMGGESGPVGPPEDDQTANLPDYWNASSDAESLRRRRDVLHGCHIVKDPHAITKCHSYNHKVICHKICVWGYRMMGRPSRKHHCDGHGWQPSMLVCEPYVNCGLKLRGPGKMKCYENFLDHGPVCVVSCEGSRNRPKVPSHTIECQSDGHWQPSPPHCTKEKAHDHLQHSHDPGHHNHGHRQHGHGHRQHNHGHRQHGHGHRQHNHGHRKHGHGQLQHSHGHYHL